MPLRHLRRSGEWDFLEIEFDGRLRGQIGGLRQRQPLVFLM
jgi:hypothetical protein